MADEYRRFWIASSDPVALELALAAAFEAGAEGAEEANSDGDSRACIYARSEGVEAVRRAVGEAGAGPLEIGDVEALPDVDWSEAWKEGLEAIRISRRLVVRPPFVEFDLEAGQRAIVIDPGQAFGTGGHASTRLCLEWIDALVDEPGALERVLDVGTGSGVLALAAVALGAGSAVGFDLDPVAIEAAREAARANDLEHGVRFFAGGIESLGDREARASLVLANLLKREMLPIATELAERMDRAGRLVLAGLLEEDVPEVLERFAREGLSEIGRRRRSDATGDWVGLCLAFG